MACIYNYLGHTFESELKLDSFLLEKLKYVKKYKDLAFSSKGILLEVNNKLEEVNKKAKHDDKLYEIWRKAQKNNKVIYGEDGEIEINEKPYIGVNAFLASIEQDRLFPEFREASYWDNRFASWREGMFSDDEIEVFGFDKNNPPKITELTKLENLKDKIKLKWKNQADIGTAVHNVMQLYFTKIEEGENKGKYVFELNDSKTYIIDHIEEKNKKYLFNQSNSDVVDQGIQHAKQVYDDLKSKLPEGNMMFFPEFLISGDATHPDSGANQKLLGIIDLLVLDSEGKVHIVDYKTSIKDYGKFDSTKRLTYGYLLATYQRILEKHGINVFGSKLYISPIKIKNFRLNGDTYIYDGIESPIALDDITSDVTEDRWSKINNFMPPSFNITISTNEAHVLVTKIMKEWFPEYSSKMQEITKEDVKEELMSRDLLKPNDKNEYIYKPYGTKTEPIVAKSETELIDKVLKYKQEIVHWRLKTASDIKAQVKEAMKVGVDNVDWTKQKLGTRGESVTWLQDQIHKYCNENWEIVENELLDNYGILMFKNKYTQQVDFVRISSSMLHVHPRKKLKKKDPIRDRLSLTGQFEKDVIEQSKSDSLMLEAVTGNMELMEMTAIINCIDGLDGNVVVGELSILNPYDSQSIQVTNEELLYCFNALSKFKAMDIDKINNGTIKFANRFRLVTNKFRDIMAKAKESEYKDDYKVYKLFESCQDLLSKAIDGNVEDQISLLQELLKMLNKDNKISQILLKTYTDSKSLNDDTISLYNSILTTIAKLKGINFRLQLSDHSKWLEKAMIFRHGWSGSYLDNPGNLDSLTLNLVTQLVTEAYLNTRDEMLRRKLKINEKIEKYKKAKGKTALALNLGANLVDIYKDLIEEVPVGNGNTDLMFKFIDNISDKSDREFLDFVLKEINRNRFNVSEEELERMLKNYDTEYYRVPLARGGSDSLISSRGLMALFRDKIKNWNPKVAFQNARDKLEGIYNAEEDTKTQQSNEVIYQMTNMFDLGETTEKRLRIIKNKGIHTFERNIETLLLKHDFAYILKLQMDKVFPLIKAATIHLCEQGAALNAKFNNDLLYINDYIRNKIKNESIINPEFESAMTIANRIKNAASKLTLAFSPVQAIYLTILSLWVDISLMIRKPDGKNSFTFNHFKTAMTTVGKDLFHFSDKPTLCSSINELYALNDMDMNTYAQRISKAKKGIWNMENFAFKFASRPDYYSRMSIFLSQMMGDGCYEAHKMVENKLVYDWKLDKRFEAFANGKTSDPKYNEQKSLYYAMALQFINEHAMYEDENGEVKEFTINMDNPIPLPRAYTNKLAEGMKSLADDIYGYYSHEKKSMVMSTALGSMWLQFKTYWSGKKNQYLQSGGVRMKGDWVQKSEVEKDENGNTVLDENGKPKEIKYYYQVDESGNIKYDAPLTTEQTIAPAMLWKGKWQEGILVTIGDIFAKTVQDPRNFINHFKEKWNEQDDNLRVCYQSNIKLLFYDLIMFFIIGSIAGALLGDWFDELKEDNKDNNDFMTGCKIAAANVAVMSVKNSFLDLNFIDSIGAPINSWTPFALEWTGRQYANIAKVATGDEDIWDGALKIASAGKQYKPILDTFKPDIFKTKKEGGTWESATTKRNREKREQSN